MLKTTQEERLYRLLIIEDKYSSRVSYEFIFGKTYYTDIPNTRAELKEIFKGKPPNAIILDLILDEEGWVNGSPGLEVLTKDIRGREGWRNVSVIAVTAKVTGVDGAEAIKQGADEYVQKPFDVTNLRNIVAKWVTARHVNPSTPTEPVPYEVAQPSS